MTRPAERRGRPALLLGPPASQPRHGDRADPLVRRPARLRGRLAGTRCPVHGGSAASRSSRPTTRRPSRRRRRPTRPRPAAPARPGHRARAHDHRRGGHPQGSGRRGHPVPARALPLPAGHAPHRSRVRTPSTTSCSRRREGFCEQFASAATVLLRAVGVPTRLAVGYADGTPTEAAGCSAVRMRTPGSRSSSRAPGWVAADPTAGAQRADGTPSRWRCLVLLLRYRCRAAEPGRTRRQRPDRRWPTHRRSAAARSATSIHSTGRCAG